MQANICARFQRAQSGRPSRALGELYTENATSTIPRRCDRTGGDLDAVGNLHRMLPSSFIFTAVGHAVGHNGRGDFLAAGPPDAAAVTDDVAHIENGRIKLLYVFVIQASIGAIVDLRALMQSSSW